MEKLLPQLRFPEFKGKWEKKKLAEVCEKIQDGNYGGDYPKSEEFIQYGIPFLTSKALGGNGDIKEGKIDYISADKHKKLKKAQLQLHDVLFTNRGSNVGSIGYVNIRIAHGNIGPQLTLLRSNLQKIKPLFLFQTMKSDIILKQVRSQDSGSAMNFFGIGSTSKFKLNIPSLPEQTKIANFLTEVDKKLTALKQKKSLLEQYKKGVMQQIFSQELRFKDDSGDDYADWKEKAFGDVTKFINGKAYKQTELLNEGKYRVLRVGNLFSNNEWYYSDLELDIDKYIEKGDLIYAWSASFGPRFWKEEKIIYHYHIWKVIPNHNIDKQFLYHVFMFDVESLKKQSQGGTMFHITKGNIESRLFYFPCIEEQTKIANLLSAIDEKINHCQSQIEKTAVWKNGLLQQLFV